MKYFFSIKENKYTKILWKNKTYFIETSYLPYDDIFIQIKLNIWYHDRVIWFTFKTIYYSCYIISTKEAAKKSIEKELIKVFGLELEKLIRTEKRKEEIKKLLGGK